MNEVTLHEWDESIKSLWPLLQILEREFEKSQTISSF